MASVFTSSETSLNNRANIQADVTKTEKSTKVTRKVFSGPQLSQIIEQAAAEQQRKADRGRKHRATQRIDRSSSQRDASPPAATLLQYKKSADRLRVLAAAILHDAQFKNKTSDDILS